MIRAALRRRLKQRLQHYGVLGDSLLKKKELADFKIYIVLSSHLHWQLQEIGKVLSVGLTRGVVQPIGKLKLRRTELVEAVQDLRVVCAIRYIQLELGALNRRRYQLMLCACEA